MSWKGERQRHAMSARGIRTQSEIQRDMARLQEQQQQLELQKKELQNQMNQFKMIDQIDNEFFRRIDEILQYKMENTPPNEDEFQDVYNNLELEDYIEIGYGGDYKYFLDDWPLIMEKVQEDYEPYDDDETEYITNQRKAEGDWTEDDDDDDGKHGNIAYVQNMYVDDFRKFYFDVVYGYGGERSFLMEDPHWIMEKVKEHIKSPRGLLDDDFVLEYYAKVGGRSALDDRFKVSEKEKELVWKETLLNNNITQEQYDYIKSMKGDT